MKYYVEAVMIGGDVDSSEVAAFCEILQRHTDMARMDIEIVPSYTIGMMQEDAIPVDVWENALSEFCEDGE